MKGSKQRVRAVLNGERPDRIPLYELIRNDRVIEYFTGVWPTPENGEGLVFRTFPLAVDATRPGMKSPAVPVGVEREEILPDGRRWVIQRWTSWIEPIRYASSETYAQAKRTFLANAFTEFTEEDQAQLDAYLARYRTYCERLGDDFFLFMGAPGIGLMGLYGEVGLDAFALYLYDCPEVISDLLEYHTIRAIQFVEHLPPDHGIEGVFIGDDVAFKTATFFSPAYFEQEYFERLARVVAAYHAKGIKVNFHSDGNLNGIMDGLVAAGIDVLNPLEVAAGMDIADLHRRYPNLIFAGGIDVSQLLPLGTPQQVADAVVHAIEDSEGQIMQWNWRIPLCHPSYSRSHLPISRRSLFPRCTIGGLGS